MNREIKFKYIFQHDDTGRIVTKVFGIEDVENALNNDDYRLYGVVARCQLTGLKDKNGKEIYEGDILTDNSLVNDDGIRFNGVIRFERGAFRFAKTNCSCVDCLGIVLDDATEYEVIGNIYENPELLK